MNLQINIEKAFRQYYFEMLFIPVDFCDNIMIYRDKDLLSFVDHRHKILAGIVVKLLHLSNSAKLSVNNFEADYLVEIKFISS